MGPRGTSVATPLMNTVMLAAAHIQHINNGGEKILTDGL
jgi:hypothetical protein